MSAAAGSDEWVRYNHLTACYETKDGTVVGAELFQNIQCLADVLYISILRSEQRKTMAEAKERNNHDPSI